jgi:UDP-glucose 4-epimerase
MKVAVTGGSGLLGTAVLRRLAADRTITGIVSLDRRPPVVASKKVHAVTADIQDPGFARHLTGCSALIHLAFILADWAPRSVMQAVNVEGSQNVFRAAAQAGVQNVAYASSIAAYGVVPGHPDPIVEDTPRRRQDDFTYAANKFDVEAILDGFEADHPEMTIARLRPGIVLGARVDNPLGKAFGRRIFLDNGAPPLPYVWDEDVAAAAVLAIKKGARGAFNLVASDPRPAAELARESGLRLVRVPRALGVAAARMEPVILALGGKPAFDRAWLEIPVPELYYSSEKAKRDLGWAPRYPTTTDVLRRVGETARGVESPRIAVFMRFAALGAARQPPREERFDGDIHLELTGPGGADYTLRFTGGRLRIEPGMPRPPISVISLRAATFTDLLAGREAAPTLEMTGKVRVEGEPVGTMLLAGLATMLKLAAEDPGARGFPARGLLRWMAA